MLSEEMFKDWKDYAVRNEYGEIIGISKDAPESARKAYKRYAEYMKMAEAKGIIL